MEDFEHIYQFGSRGIDTQYERDLINYEPVLEYIKKVAPSIQLAEDFVPSKELEYATKYNIPNALEALNKAKSATQTLLNVLKKRLKDVKVLIQDSIKEKEDAMKAYAGGDYITFDVFDKACRDDKPEAKLIVMYYMEKSDMVEALIYPDAILLDEDTDCNIGFMNKDAIDLAHAIGYSLEKDIKEATDEWIAQRADLENQIADLKSQEEIVGPITWQDYQDTINDIQSQINEINHYDTVPVISSVVINRAESTYATAVKLYGLTIAETAAIIGGDSGLKSIINALGINTDANQDDIVIQINTVKKRIADIKKIVSVTNALSSMKAIELTDLIMMILQPILKQVANQLISLFANLKVTLIKPPLDWLDELSERTRLVPIGSVPNSFRPIERSRTGSKVGAYYDKAIEAINQPLSAAVKVVKGVESATDKLISFSQAVDDLAHTIIDVANNVEDKFDDFILDFYKSTTARADALNEKFTNCEKKKWAQTIYKVLDAILITLEAARDPMALRSLENVESYIDRVKSKLDWNNNDTNFLNPGDVISETTKPVVEPITEDLEWSVNAAESEE